MKILTVYDHYPVCGGKYITEALQRLGHDTRSWGRAMGSQIWGMHVSARHAHHPTYFGDEAEGFMPDLVLVVDSQPDLQSCRSWPLMSHVPQHVPFAVYGLDNHVRRYGAPGIDHYFFAHKFPSINDMTAQNITWLPCGYDSSFAAGAVPWAERPYDVVLCGVLYPRREAIVRYLERSGFKVATQLGVFGEQYATMHHNARIALNISANYDLPMRVFEGVALGCVVLTDRIPDMWQVLPSEAAGIYEDLSAVHEQSPFRRRAIWEASDPIRMVQLAGHIINTHHEPFDTSWLVHHTWEERAGTIVKWAEREIDRRRAAA